MSITKRARTISSVLLFVGLGVLGWTSNAFAQTQPIGPTPANETDRPASKVEEVIVTAQKRAENVQSVPATVTPITGVTIERLHIEDLKDLTGSVPNLQVTENSGVALAASVSIRGIGETNNPTPYAGREVAIVVDGVVQGTDQLGLGNQFDLSRIEVLAGPQGTLFGANTTGGVINIVTNQPTGTYGAYGTITAGNYGAINALASVDFPIVDGQLDGKLVYSHEGNDGFYTNLYNGTRVGGLDSNALRGFLQWTPNANVEVSLKSEVQLTDIADTYLQNLAYPGEVFYRPTTQVNFTIYDNIPGSNTVETQSHTVTVNWTSPIGKVTSISNVQQYRDTGNLDVGGIDCYCLDQFGRDHGWQLSEELRDVFHPIDSIEVLAGVFGERWADNSDGLSTVPFADPDLVTRNVINETSTNLSGFTQVYWHITDKLRLQAGFRLSWDQVRLYEAALSYDQPAGTSPLLLANNVNGAILLPFAPGNAPASGEHSWLSEGGKIGLDYTFTDDLMAYGYYARGFKSGGYNGRVTLASTIGPYNPETVDSFEAGVKSEWLDERLQINADAFLNKWTNMQVSQSNYTGATIASVILNAAAATTKGVELSAQAVPTDGVSLNGNLGYLQAAYDKFLSSNQPLCPPPPAIQPPGCAVSYAGRDLPYAPHLSGTIGGSFTHAVLNGDAVLTVQYTYTGAKWGNYTQAPTEALPAVGLLNANLTWGPETANWTISLWGRNLTNKTYVATALDVPPLFTEATLGDPREWGADLKFQL